KPSEMTSKASARPGLAIRDGTVRPAVSTPNPPPAVNRRRYPLTMVPPFLAAGQCPGAPPTVATRSEPSWLTFPRWKEPIAVSEPGYRSSDLEGNRFLAAGRGSTALTPATGVRDSLRAPSGLTAAPRGRTPGAARPRLPSVATLRASAWGQVRRPQPRDPVQDAAKQLARDCDL